MAAREAATWRPQRISAAEFDLRLTPLPTYRGEENIAPLWWRRLAKVARSKGWQLEAVSLDHRRMLVSGSAPNFCYTAAVLDSNGRLTARLPSRPAKEFCREWDKAQFSPDSTLVSFSQFEVSPTQVFEARTGQFLWKGMKWGEKVCFSPDGRFAALSDSKGDLQLRNARDGVRIRKLPRPASLLGRLGVFKRRRFHCGKRVRHFFHTFRQNSDLAILVVAHPLRSQRAPAFTCAPFCLPFSRFSCRACRI